MRYRYFTAIVLAIIACSSKKPEKSLDDTFRAGLIDASTAGTLQQLTTDGRSIYPVFGQGDTIVLYKRLLITDPKDTIAYFPNEMVRPYGINIVTKDLFTTEGDYDFPEVGQLPDSELPKQQYENAVWGIRSPNKNISAFESLISKEKSIRHIYLSYGDSIKQLTYGEMSCFIDRFSNTGRYLTAIYNTGPTWILIFDLKKNMIYRINRGNQSDSLIDYLTCFSPNDNMMLFIRSVKQYRWGRDYFGNVWLYKFNDISK
jgi:hypothetical protein